MDIPSCLVDINILLRMTRRSDPERALVDVAWLPPCMSME
jgi:hypothetical protein